MSGITVTNTDPVSGSFDGLLRAYPSMGSNLCTGSAYEHECAIRLSAALQRTGLVPVKELAKKLGNRRSSLGRKLGAGCPTTANDSASFGGHVDYLQLRAEGLAVVLEENPFYLGRSHKFYNTNGDCGVQLDNTFGPSRGIVYYVDGWQNDNGIWRDHIDLYNAGTIMAGRHKAKKYGSNASQIWFWRV